jgi:hypothetical protein
MNLNSFGISRLMVFGDVVSQDRMSTAGVRPSEREKVYRFMKI